MTADPSYSVEVISDISSNGDFLTALDNCNWELTLAEARDFAGDYNVRLSLYTKNGELRFRVSADTNYTSA